MGVTYIRISAILLTGVPAFVWHVWLNDTNRSTFVVIYSEANRQQQRQGVI